MELQLAGLRTLTARQGRWDQHALLPNVVSIAGEIRATKGAQETTDRLSCDDALERQFAGCGSSFIGLLTVAKPSLARFDSDGQFPDVAPVFSNRFRAA